MTKRLIIFALWLSAATLCCAEDVKPELKAVLAKKEDSVWLEWKESGCVAELTSESGIGGAKLALKKGEWPQTLKLTTNLRNLESFTVSTKTINVNADLKAAGFTYAQGLKDDGKPGETLKVTFKLSVKLENGRVAIEIPLREIAGKDAEVSLGWINEFRN